jgi:hypothetical protein
MTFYPRLYEGDIAEGDYKKILSKYIGAGKDSIEIDPIDRSIIYAKGKTKTSKIDGWKDIFLFPSNYRDLMINFLQQQYPNVNVKDVVATIESDKKKKSRKSFVPSELPPFDKNLTYGDFWKYQLDINANDIEKDINNFESKPTSSSSKSKSGGIETDYKIPENIPVFFKNNNKLKQWKLFLDNVTSSSGKSVIGEFNQLFEYMSTVIDIEDESQIPEWLLRFKIKKGRAPLALNNMDEINEWKSDMINFIGKYTAKTIWEVNDSLPGSSGTVYTEKIIPQKGTKSFGFLATLMLMEPSGMGRGEVLMAYIIQGAKFAGGGESFDITVTGNDKKEIVDKIEPDIIVGDTTFELKDYSDTNKASIRLGTHGALTRFSWWKEIERTVKIVRDITKELGEDKVKDILEDTYPGQQLYYVWNLVQTNKPYQGNRNIGSGVDAGELNNTKVAALKVFYSLMHEFFSRNSKKEKDEYTYAILKGRDVKPQTVEIDPIKKDELKSVDSLKVSYDKEDVVKFKELAGVKYIKDPLSLKSDLDKLGEHYAEASATGGNKGVDYFMVFVKDKLDIDKLEDFVFDGISQKAAKITGKHNKPEEQYADKAFIEWKKQNDKSYYEIYQDLIIKDKEASLERKRQASRKKTNESFYPRLKEI